MNHGASEQPFDKLPMNQRRQLLEGEAPSEPRRIVPRRLAQRLALQSRRFMGLPTRRLCRLGSQGERKSAMKSRSGSVHAERVEA